VSSVSLTEKPERADVDRKFYRKYRPFRNYVRGFELVPSLVDVWRYSLHLTEDKPLPAGYAFGVEAPTAQSVKEIIYPWELDVLVREIVLNASDHGQRSLQEWNNLAVAVNHIRRLDELAFTLGSDPSADVMLELHRVSHRQFPWQMNKGIAPIVRVLKIFGEAAVETIVMRELCMTMRQFVQLGFAITGNFQRNWGMSTIQDYTPLGISREASQAVLSRITCSLEQLRAETINAQSYDRDWLYAWNPLEARPLISIDPAFPDRVVCPIPRFLFRRLSAGIFYDLVKSAGFDNAFGRSFQAYVGDVIKATCPPSRFIVQAEEPYYVGTNKMHGVDWILSDSTGHLFIESKTKRLTMNAKTLSDTVALQRDLLVMATAIVQHYRNIRDALNGKTKWIPDGLPVYPLVLTLDDWFIFSPRVDEMLNLHIRRLLTEAGIALEVLAEMPFTVASAHEFEITSQVIAQIGISPLMSKKTVEEQRSWSLLPFVQTNFSNEMRHVNRRLFEEEWGHLMPAKPSETTA
jgi:hypothetical protein